MDVSRCSPRRTIAGQAFSRTGMLSRTNHRNLPLSKLRRMIPMKEWSQDVYTYVVASISKSKDQEGFIQKGTAPNFQGDRLTLCTCKHLMRSSLPRESWEGTWVSGFTSISLTEDHRNALFYLMRISEAFESHHELWYSTHLSAKAKRMKTAENHVLGDLYRPRRRFGANDRERFSYHNYVPPRSGHDHAPRYWHRDINYRGYGGRRPALLLGDREYSFLWDSLCIFLRNERGPSTI